MATTSSWFPSSLRQVALSTTLAFLVLAVLASAAPAPQKPASEPQKPAAKAPTEPPPLEAHFTDDSVLKLTLRDERIEITTPYGKLLVPVTDIQRIEFGTRIHPADVRKIEVAISKLGSAEFAEREAAVAELLHQKERAYQALQAAAKSPDAEVAKRALDLLERLRASVPPDRLVMRVNDVLYTVDSKITGKIEATAFQAHTTQFGEVPLKLADLRELSRGGAAQGRVAAVMPDPGSLAGAGMQLEVGQIYYFQVTGAAGGSVWGTDVYTSDSFLASVAVHAGVLVLGQTGVVKVSIVPAPPGFSGTNRNGIQSSDWGAYPIAFQVSQPEGGMVFRGRAGRGPGMRGGGGIGFGGGPGGGFAPPGGPLAPVPSVPPGTELPRDK